MHNLGKHLVICYFPEEYNEIKNIIATKGSDEQSASKMVLGVSYSELGKGIGKSWGFPETDLLKSIANYASELCAVAAQADDMKRDEAMQAVCSKYKLTVSFPVNRTITMIEDAATKIDQYAEMFNINKSRNPLLQRLKSYGEEKALPGESSGSNVPDASSGMAMSLRTETIKRLSRAEEQSEMLKNCITEINEMLNSQSSISDAIYMILETMYRGFEFNRVLFCMVDQSHAKMAARFGFGENIDNILDQFQFKITRSSDFFNISVMRMKDFIVDDSHAAGIRENLPGWYLKIINAHSFLIYPLIIKEKCIGMFYADKKTSRMLDNDQRDYINILRDKTIWTMLHKH